jgi:hypothetical protein
MVFDTFAAGLSFFLWSTCVIAVIVAAVANKTNFCTMDLEIPLPSRRAPPYLLHDRDKIFGAIFRHRVHSLDMSELLIAPRSPWQNPYVERGAPDDRETV